MNTNTQNQTPEPATCAGPNCAVSTGSLPSLREILGWPTESAVQYRDLVRGDILAVGDEGLIDGRWVRMAPAFAGHYYIPDLMAPMRRVIANIAGQTDAESGVRKTQ